MASGAKTSIGLWGAAMAFDPYAFALDHGLGAGSGATRATCAILAAPDSTNSINSTRRAASPPFPALEANSTDSTNSMASPDKSDAHASALAYSPQSRPPAHSQLDGADAPRSLCSITNKPMTWTGKVVSLDVWRRLSAWERHGPDGRIFCGVCRAWVKRDGDCLSPGCWKDKAPC